MRDLGHCEEDRCRFCVGYVGEEDGCICCLLGVIVCAALNKTIHIKIVTCYFV